MSARTLIQATRPPFLVLAPVCVFLGFAAARISAPAIDPLILAAVVLGALAAHVSVNTLNEYHDFRSGLDRLTSRTPFSGGSGALPSNPAVAGSVLRLGLFSLLLTILAGLYLLAVRGHELLPIGLLGIAIIVTYTPWLNRSALLCLLAPGAGFGLLMVTGTFVALTGEYATLPLIVSLPTFLLVNNLLLLNQYPDIAADRQSGRKHFPIRYGISSSNAVYALSVASAFTVIVLAVYLGALPPLSLAALLPGVFSLIALAGAVRHRENIGTRPGYLAANVAASILTPAVLGVSLIASPA